jgi:hypothetical protein
MFFFVVMLVAFIAIVIITGSRPRRHLGLGNVRPCSGCGQDNPGFAQFCRRCGQRLVD